MLEVEALSKHYGSLTAADSVSFRASPKEILGLLGPNGAGKSTVMRVLAGYLSATAGKAIVGGFDVATHSREVRSRLGYLPENAGLYLELRVREYLDYRASLKGLAGADLRRRVERAMELCDLGPMQRRILGQLSKGYRQRVSLAAVLVHEPPVLILDEPTVGLDPNQMREIRSLIRAIGRERTVLFSTHILSEAEAVCDRLVIMNHGQVLADGTPAELSRRFRSQALSIELVGDAGQAVKALSAIPGLETNLVQREPTVRLSVQLPVGADPGARAEVSRALTACGAVIVELAAQGTNLDEVFARITEQGAAA